MCECRATNRIGVKIGGVEGENGGELIKRLGDALDHAISVGQNNVAVVIAEQLGRLGGSNGNVITGSSFQA